MYPCVVHMNRVRWPSLDWREEIRQTKDVRQSGRCAQPLSIKTGEYGASSRSALLKIKDGGRTRQDFNCQANSNSPFGNVVRRMLYTLKVTSRKSQHVGALFQPSTAIFDAKLLCIFRPKISDFPNKDCSRENNSLSENNFI